MILFKGSKRFNGKTVAPPLFIAHFCGQITGTVLP